MNVTSTDGPLIKVGNLDIVVEDRIILAPVEKIILNIENVVITKDRKIIGLVEDVFGPVERPKYSILNDQYLIELLSSGNLKVGDPVFCLATGMKALTEDQIYLMRAQKGCDASNKFDEEPIGAHDKDDIHYSDDENEISGSKSGMLGKRNRKMDEEDWKSNRVSQSTISALKEKHSQSVNQGSMGMVQESFPMAYNSQFPPQQFIPAHPGMYYPPQGAYPDYQQGMFVPMMTHMGPPDHQLSYQQYLAQINMMYGYPQGTQTSYGPGPQIHQTEEQLPQGETPQNEEPK